MTPYEKNLMFALLALILMELHSDSWITHLWGLMAATCIILTILEIGIHLREHRSARP
jgi:hypothetical protein